MAGISEIDWGRIYAYLYKPEHEEKLNRFVGDPAKVIKEIVTEPELNIQLPSDGTLFEMLRLPTDISEAMLKEIVAGKNTNFEVFMRLCC